MASALIGCVIWVLPSAVCATTLPDDDSAVPLILVRSGDTATALLTDEMMMSREIVVKAVGPQLAGVKGLSGATILGDGRVVLILDAAALVRDDGALVEIRDAGAGCCRRATARAGR